MARLYKMSFADGVWKLWRLAPGISGSWERSSDGSSWEHAFDPHPHAGIPLNDMRDMQAVVKAIGDTNQYMTLATADQDGNP